MAKIIQAFHLEEEIPTDAKYLCNIYDKGKHLFIYEVKKTKTKKSNANNNAKLNIEDLSEDEQTIERVISYLNRKTDSKFRPNAKESIKYIKARIEDGARPEDFKEAVDNMCKKWLGNEKMEMYLRPKTLFGPEFWSYVSADKKGPGSEALENVLNDMDNMQEKILKNSLEGNCE